MADEKYFNHYFISPYFAPECPVLRGVPGFVKCVYWLTSWQNRARWSKVLLPVNSKVGSKPDRVTTNSLFYPLLAAFFTIGNSSSQEPYLLSMLLDKHFITISTFESVS